MTLRKTLTLFLCGTLLVGISVFTFACQGTQTAAIPPTDAEIKKLISTVKATMKREIPSKEERENSNNVALQALKEIDLRLATLEQLDTLVQAVFADYLPAMLSGVRPRLTELAQAPTHEGLKAGLLLANHYLTDEDKKSVKRQIEWITSYKTLIAHPALPALLEKGGGDALEFLFAPQYMNPRAIKETKLLEALLPILDLPMPPDMMTPLPTFFDLATDDDTETPKDLQETLRSKTLSRLEKALQSLYRQKKRGDLSVYLEKAKTYLNGPTAKGTLIGNLAPDIQFRWASGKFERLKHLKGKVVLLDFWATWCGPCIASFPNLRKLQERYSGYPVVILGVTSLQGYHIDIKNKKNISTEGKPQKEIELMQQFIKDMRMSWFVGFSKTEVFDANYGVRGIPHAALIAPDGSVRFNRLRPYEPPYKEAEKIDALLKEFHLAYPQQPMEQKNYAE